LLKAIQPYGFEFVQKEIQTNHFEFVIRLGEKNLKTLKDLDLLTVSLQKNYLKILKKSIRNSMCKELFYNFSTSIVHVSRTPFIIPFRGAITAPLLLNC